MTNNPYLTYFRFAQTIGKRDSQQDFGAIVEEVSLESGGSGHLFIVADGMGGHSGGAEASETAVEAFVTKFREESSPLRLRFAVSLKAANQAITDFVERTPSLKGMGTTMLAAVVEKNQMTWLSVGDSPLWLLRGGEVTRLNEDHSMTPVLQKMVEIGELSQEDMEADPARHQLRSVLVGEEIKLIDNTGVAFDIRQGDIIILASDGLDSLTGDELLELSQMQSFNVDDYATSLIAAVEAKNLPKQDNTSLTVVYQPNAPTISSEVESRPQQGPHAQIKAAAPASAQPVASQPRNQSTLMLLVVGLVLVIAIIWLMGRGQSDGVQDGSGQEDTVPVNKIPVNKVPVNKVPVVVQETNESDGQQAQSNSDSGSESDSTSVIILQTDSEATAEQETTSQSAENKTDESNTQDTEATQQVPLISNDGSGNTETNDEAQAPVLTSDSDEESIDAGADSEQGTEGEISGSESQQETIDSGTAVDDTLNERQMENTLPEKDSGNNLPENDKENIPVKPPADKNKLEKADLEKQLKDKAKEKLKEKQNKQSKPEQGSDDNNQPPEKDDDQKRELKDDSK